MAVTSERAIVYGDVFENLLYSLSTSKDSSSAYRLKQFLGDVDGGVDFGSQAQLALIPAKHLERAQTAIQIFDNTFSNNEIETSQPHDQSQLDTVAANHASSDTDRFLQLTDGETPSRVADWVLHWQKKWAAGAPLVDGPSERASTSTSGGALSTGASRGEPSGSNTPSRRRKKADKGDQEEDNGESREAKSDSSFRPRSKYLACPIYKHNPDGHGHNESCSKRSWPTVSRLKTDHIFPHHRVSGDECQRCGDIFGVDEKSQHENCEEQLFLHREGVGISMVEQLHKKTIARNGTEEEKWHAVYSIIFPYVDYNDHPTPYLEDILESRQETLALFQPYILPIVSQAVRTTAQGPSWAENITWRIVNDIMGLINGNSVPATWPPDFPFYHDSTDTTMSDEHSHL
ncbi:hypothetical protein F4804DRAFT_316742 [Jackrogersella minutella]|nr:hypothetical protein F4804DRAFT_316742 [Jackrogersella minutella]